MELVVAAAEVLSMFVNPVRLDRVRRSRGATFARLVQPDQLSRKLEARIAPNAKQAHLRPRREPLHVNPARQAPTHPLPEAGGVPRARLAKVHKRELHSAQIATQVSIHQKPGVRA